MALGRLTRPGLQALRAVAGEHSAIERFLRGKYVKRIKERVDKEVGDGFVQHAGEKFVVLSSKEEPEPRVGIYMRGGCDLPSLFAATPLFRDNLRGTVAIFNDGIGITDARADILLQALRGVNPDHVAETMERLKLPAEYFSPRLLEKTFVIPGSEQFGEFQKTVIVLSAAPNLVRTAYRHREHGYIVDPGGWWLTQSMESVLSDLSTARWFKEKYEAIGKITTAQFRESFREIVRLVKETTGAQVLVYNALIVEPGSLTHNYQFVNNSQSMRGRELYLALIDLSRELDFHIVDVDRVLKKAGVSKQTDFAHFLSEHSSAIAAEAHRILVQTNTV